MRNNLLFKVVLPFTIIVTIALVLGEMYIRSSKDNYIQAIKNEVKLLIQSKQEQTSALSYYFATGNKQIIKIMDHQEYKKLYNPTLFNLPKVYASFLHLGIHIVDEKGINRYLSWTHKSIGKDILRARADLASLIKNPRVSSGISIGKFDITFKGISPIYSKTNKFLGFIEVITHFNSIAKKLQKDDIYSAVIIDKRYNKQLKYALSPYMIDDYHISNLDLNNEVKYHLKKENISHLLSKKVPIYIHARNSFFDGYEFFRVPILNAKQQHIGEYFLFARDTHHLWAIKFILYILFSFLAVFYLFIIYLLFKEKKETNYLIQTLDSSVKKKTEENLQLVYKDILTGVYKRAKFIDDRKTRSERFVVMTNIKKFSKINEIYGFAVGDELLQQLCAKIEKSLNDKIYRVHADEFLFFSKDIEKDIQKIKEMCIAHIFSLKNRTIQVRVSLRFAANPNEENVLRKLSIAIKVAKQLPFKDYVLYMPTQYNKDFIIYNEILYDALFLKEKATIVPYFQGIRNNATGKITKYESLARIVTKERVYTPYFFISIAQDSGFLHEITKIMIEKTFAILAMQPEEITCSINITEDDLQTHLMKEILLKASQKYNICVDRIILEILEGVTSSGAKNNIEQLYELKELGFKLAIDDFGVEYSNFERIQELDVDFLKIDAKYIKSIHKNPKSYQIVKAISQFAKSMNIEVIAEFVENKEIQKKIQELNIEFSQGYFFSTPNENFKDY